MILSIALLAIVPFLVLDVSAQSVVPTSREDVIGLDNIPGYFWINATAEGTASIANGKFTYSATNITKGHIYIPSDTTISNALFKSADVGKVCVMGIVLSSEYNPNFTIPNDVSGGIAYGFAYSAAFPNILSDGCELAYTDMNPQLDVNKELQVILYDQAGKQGYSYLRTANINTAQNISACTTANFDDATKTLKGSTKMCSADVGSDLVIYTKVMQFYGAKNATSQSVDPMSRENVNGLGVFVHLNINTTAAGTGTIITDGKYTYSATNTTKGHIYIPSDTTISNTTLFVAGDIGKICVRGIVLSSEYNPPQFTIPNNVSSGIAYGFAYANDDDRNPQSCTLRNTAINFPLDVNNVLQVVLYDQAGKQGYSYLRTANINTAQNISACTTANFDDATKTLKGSTKMCSADVGSDLVIYTKVMQFYGANEIVGTTPDSAQEREYLSFLKKLYLPAI